MLKDRLCIFCKSQKIYCEAVGSWAKVQTFNSAPVARLSVVQKAMLTVGVAATAILAMASMTTWAQDIDKGRTEFMTSCARCHGADGKGSGPDAANLKVKPADLTALAKRTNGLFNPGAVYQMIDGRNVRFGHRSADMPIWGCRHNDRSMTLGPANLPKIRKNVRRFTAHRSARHETELDSLLDLSCDSEQVIRKRILSIVEYLSSIQKE